MSHINSGPRVYVIIPVFNRRELTLRCLTLLQTQTYPSIGVIVVDDASTDGTVDAIRNSFPEVTVINGTGTLWWTGSTNLGITEALRNTQSEDFVLLLNDDLEFDHTLISRLVEFGLANPGTIVGSVAVSNTDRATITDGGTIVNWWTAKCSPVNRGLPITSFSSDTVVRVSVLTGRGVLYPAQVFKSHGLFYADRFEQCGDWEYPARLERLGYKLVVHYGARVFTYFGTTLSTNESVRFTFKDIWNYFFHIRSATRIKYRFFLGFSGGSRNPLRMLCFWGCDFGRVCGGLARRLLSTHNSIALLF